MIGADQKAPVRKIGGKTVTEFGSRLGNDSAAFTVGRKKTVKSDFAQSNNDFDSVKQLEFLHEIGTATDKLGYARFVFRRRAADCRRDIAIFELETIVSVNGVRLTGESGVMQSAV